MATATLIFLLLILVAFSGLVGRFLRIPLPILQIVLGVLLAWPSAGLKVELEPEVFLLVFVPPLLFLDAYLAPKRELLQVKTPIIGLAFGLVFLTILLFGYALNWLLPVVPLPVAFALAAVLSPTDPVAVSSIVNRDLLPARVIHILEGEALLNDASGLVIFRFAVAAAMSGQFSPGQTALSFVLVTVGGAATGMAGLWVTARLMRLLARLGDIRPEVQVLVLGLMPFAVYLLAERLGASGILAAVTAGSVLGVTAAYLGGLFDDVMMRIVDLKLALPGILFVALFAVGFGESLPVLIVLIGMVYFPGVVRIVRDTPRHEIVDLNVSTSLRGDFAAAHTDGDQSAVLPTDTQKNTAFAFAKQHGVTSPEDYALALARRLLEAAPAATGARVAVEEYAWDRIPVRGPDGAQGHDQAFVRRGGEVRTTEVDLSAEAAHVVFSEWPRFDLVDWEATLRHGLDFAKVEHWLAGGDRRAQFFAAISRRTRDWTRAHGRPALMTADALAMAWALQPEGATEVVERPAAVETGGRLCRGATVVDWNRQTGAADNVAILARYDQARFESLARAALTAG